MDTASEIRAFFKNQAVHYERMGSPFTARLSRLLGEGLSEEDAVGGAVLGWPGDPDADALPLRLMGGLHSLVLSGRAPALAEVYPGGVREHEDGALWRAVEDVLHTHADSLPEFLKSPPQTNEVGRSNALMGGFHTIASETGLPLSIFEIGASAGLNLFWDHYRYNLGAVEWGPEDAPLTLTPEWSGSLPPLGDVKVAARAGCDQNPIDASDEGARLHLLSYAWADQPERRKRLEAALDHVAAMGLKLEHADAGDWASERLAALTPGVATVLYHSIFWQYLTPQVKARIRSAIDSAAAQATADAPFAWLRMEVHESLQFAGLYLKQWPDPSDNPQTRLLAEVDFHGRWVRWL